MGKQLSKEVNVAKLTTSKAFMIPVYLILPVFLLIFLYDPDGAAVGKQMFGDPGGVVLGLATLLGDLVWIVGILMWLVAGSQIALAVNPEALDESIRMVIRQSYEAGVEPKNHFAPMRWKLIINWISLAIGLIGLASGFWFTTSGWVIASVIMLAMRKKASERFFELLAEYAQEQERTVNIREVLEEAELATYDDLVELKDRINDKLNGM